MRAELLWITLCLEGLHSQDLSSECSTHISLHQWLHFPPLSSSNCSQFFVNSVTISWGPHCMCYGWGFHLMFVPVALQCKATTLPTTAGSRPLCSSPFTTRRKQCSLCLCRCNDKAVVVVVLWSWERELMNCKWGRWSKSRRIPRAHPGGGLVDFMMCEFI